MPVYPNRISSENTWVCFGNQPKKTQEDPHGSSGYAYTSAQYGSKANPLTSTFLCCTLYDGTMEKGSFSSTEDELFYIIDKMSSVLLVLFLNIHDF